MYSTWRLAQAHQSDAVKFTVLRCAQVTSIMFIVALSEYDQVLVESSDNEVVSHSHSHTHALDLSHTTQTTSSCAFSSSFGIGARAR